MLWLQNVGGVLKKGFHMAVRRYRLRLLRLRILFGSSPRFACRPGAGAADTDAAVAVTTIFAADVHLCAADIEARPTCLYC